MGRGMEGEWNEKDDIRNSGSMPELSEFSKTVIIPPPPLFINPFFPPPFPSTPSYRPPPPPIRRISFKLIFFKTVMI